MAKIITFAQQKGGSGKTTLLTQLAVALAETQPVAVIDLDPQKTLTGWMDERIRRTGEADLDLIESSEWRIGVDIRKASRDADLILIDCAGSADITLGRVMRESDLVLSPAQPSAPDLWATSATLRMAAKEGIDSVVVLNRVPPRGGAVEEIAKRLSEEGGEVMDERIGNRVAFSTAFGQGAGVTETARTSRASDEIRALATALTRRLG